MTSRKRVTFKNQYGEVSFFSKKDRMNVSKCPACAFYAYCRESGEFDGKPCESWKEDDGK